MTSCAWGALPGDLGSPVAQGLGLWLCLRDLAEARVGLHRRGLWFPSPGRRGTEGMCTGLCVPESQVGRDPERERKPQSVCTL